MLKVLRPFSAAVLLAPVLLAAGCHRGGQAGVVATVNGHAIQNTDLDKIYNAQMANNPEAQKPSADQLDSTRLQILQELITREIVDQRAAKLNLTASNDEVDAKLAEVKAPYTEEQFNARLKASGQTVDELRRDIRRFLTQDKLLNKEINSRITVTDADVSHYFNAHKSEYNLIDTRYHLAGIQVTSQPSQDAENLQNSKANTDEEARKKIQTIKNRLDAGEDFGTLAMNFSESPQTAPNGGDMGYVFDAQMKSDPTIYAAISQLKAGQITDVLPLMDAKTHKTDGYAIYKLLSKDPPGQRDLNDPRVLQSIRQQLHESRSQLLKAAYFEMLRDQARVQNFLAERIFRDDAK